MVRFIGAGSGDKELLTIKGKRYIDEADYIIYAGSLVNPEIFEDVKKSAVLYNSAGMTLEEVIAVMVEGERKGLSVVRVHTGDPAIFGAHREQMDVLDAEQIEYEIIPGVSSFLAAAAALKKEYTLPAVSQTVILTRMEGRTPVPEKESIRELAKHQATMIIFLSVGRMEELTKELQKEYRENTPVAVVYKASWPDERILHGTLQDIGQKVKEAGIGKTALVVVGDFLGDDYELSCLYNKHFSHEYRKGVKESGNSIIEC